MAWASKSLLTGAGGGQSTACLPQSPGRGALLQGAQAGTSHLTPRVNRGL